MFLGHDVSGFYDGFCGGVVSEDDSYFVFVEEWLVDVCLFEGFSGCHEGVFSFFGESDAVSSVQDSFEYGWGHDSGECGLVSVFDSLRVDADAAFSFSKGLCNGFFIGSQAGPDAHAGDDYSSFHVG